MTEHNPTPGPWSFVENIEAAHKFGVDDAWEVGSKEQKTGVALVPGSIANARLIAAAPELLAGCRAALNMVDGNGAPPDWDWLREIASKASSK